MRAAQQARAEHRVYPDDFTANLATELPAFCDRYNEARAKFGLKPLPLTP